MSIKLPMLFEAKLDNDSKAKSIVYAAISDFSKWFESNNSVFFPDYTDHGIKHLNNVIRTAASMVVKEASEIISSADITVFILASLLHDSALYLTESGFQHLIHGGASGRVISGFDEKRWPVLWEEFLFEAHRWNDSKLIDMFGIDFVKNGNSPSDVFDRWGNLTTADYKLTGEFIRRHHARLSHEFAVFGVPGVEASALALPTSCDNETKDLIGVIARSHGMPIRTCVDYIASNYHTRDYQGIHAVYLMALLRLSDYLQIDADRAPQSVFKYRVIPSRQSNLELHPKMKIPNQLKC